MRTLHTGPVLAYMLIKYGWLMNSSFKNFMRKVILRIDRCSEIYDGHDDILANTLCDLQYEGDYSDKMVEQFLEYVKLYEINE